jgi:glycosyltransferase involved in cell wall biosynthesis
MSKIEFIIPNYNRPNQLMGVISSIFAQTSSNWKIHVVADGMYDGYQKVKDYFTGDERIKFTELDGPHKDWGHTPRNYGLEHSTEEWVVMTGDDNYYMPVFVEEFLNVVDSNTHFVFCNMVHNWTNKQYLVINSIPKLGGIDIGNFMSKSDLAKKIKLNVAIEQSDGLFVEEYLRKYNQGTIKKINKPLYVHN